MDILSDIITLQQKLTNIEHQYWIDNILFSFNWWFLLLLIITPWFLWWKFLDKNRIKEILLYGFYIMLVSTILDDIGLDLNLWVYPYQLVQIMDRLNSVDLAALPVIYMLIYQYFSKWKSFFIATILLSFCFTFLFEPILVWLGIYKLLAWKYIYSFPIYILIGLFGKWFIAKINSISH